MKTPEEWARAADCPHVGTSGYEPCDRCLRELIRAAMREAYEDAAEAVMRVDTYGRSSFVADAIRARSREVLGE